jgi:phosphohistidine phosphatase
MKLYLMRHGIAAPKDVDPNQGLTAEGRQAIEQLAKRLLAEQTQLPTRQKINIAQIFHSDKTRAQQTAEIMAGIIAPAVTPVCREGLKPNDNPQNLLADIETWDRDTLITSHLPFIPGLLNLLTQSQHSIAFDPATIACLSKTDDSWQLDWIARAE